MHTSAGHWNHNIHYHRVILDTVPADARSALDVGCGDGLLARDLRRMVPDVTGIDVDGSVLARAGDLEEDDLHEDIAWVQGDVMTHEFDRRFDVVASVATLHHLPALDDALVRLSALTAPGGVLAIVGLARSGGPKDLAYDVLGALQHRRLARRHGYWEHTAATVRPPHSYATVRRAVERTLPGARWRRLPMWRYAVTWHHLG